MKKPARTLQLTTETIRELQARELRAIRGAGTGDNCESAMWTPRDLRETAPCTA